MDYFPCHIWDVIRNPLTNSIIFQDDCSNHQPVSFRRKTSYVPTHPVQLICVYQYHEVLAPSDMLKLSDDPLSIFK